MTTLAIRLAFAGETMFPPRATLFLRARGTSRFPTPLHGHVPESSP
jgi:hypothetical protein